MNRNKLWNKYVKRLDIDWKNAYIVRITNIRVI